MVFEIEGYCCSESSGNEGDMRYRVKHLDTQDVLSDIAYVRELGHTRQRSKGRSAFARPLLIILKVKMR